MSNSRQVFISYGRDEIGNSFVEDLYKRILSISKHELVPFRDVYNLKDGERWDDGLRRQIQDSFLIIVVCSEKANNSKHVRDEWVYAMGANKRIIAISIENSKTPIPDELMLYHTSNLEFINPNENDWQRLINKIVDIFEDVYVPSHVERAKEFAEHPLADYRKQALQSLRDNEHPQAVEALADLAMSSYLPETRWLASLHLAYKAKDNRAINMLNDVAHGQTQYDDIEEAINGLFQVETLEAFSMISEVYITTEESYLKERIVAKFCSLRNKNAIPAMRKCLKNEDKNAPRNKISLLSNLAEFGDVEILEDIESFLLQKSKQFHVDNQAEYNNLLRVSMKSFKTEDVLPLYGKLIERSEENRNTLTWYLARQSLYELEERAEPKVLDWLNQFVKDKRLQGIVLEAQQVSLRLESKLRNNT